MVVTVVPFTELMLYVWAKVWLCPRSNQATTDKTAIPSPLRRPGRECLLREVLVGDDMGAVAKAISALHYSHFTIKIKVIYDFHNI